jgi:hypothetical protein
MKPRKRVINVKKGQAVLIGEGKRNQGVAAGTSEILVPQRGNAWKVMPQVKKKVPIYRDPDNKKKIYDAAGNPVPGKTRSRTRR